MLAACMFGQVLLVFKGHIINKPQLKILPFVVSVTMKGNMYLAATYDIIKNIYF